MARRGWDWRAYELFKEWNRHPVPVDARVGSPVRHLPTDAWFSFGSHEGAELIVVDRSGAAVVLPAEECRPGWDPEVDPELFQSALAEIKRG